MREIGSEFWKTAKQHIQNDETIYLSGRTALDAIIRDAVKSYGITSALLPSYCCHTMIEPFLTNSIDVRFYDVYINKENILCADVPTPRKHELLYIMKYFGDTDLNYNHAENPFTGWTISVEDLTHSCLSEEYSTNANYWFTSYRKWFGVSGIAVAGKQYGKLAKPSREQNHAYFNLRNQAFSLKQQFTDGKCVKKQDFLDIFGKAECLLGEDYKNFGAEYEDIYDLFYFLDNKKDIHRKRRDNVKILIEGLTELKGLQVFVNFNNEKKCPLFVPIIVKGELRDSLRKYLISRDIYCPVHWPLSEQHKGLSERALEIYKQELSLVCDQRYDINDMKRIVEEIRQFVTY